MHPFRLYLRLADLAKPFRSWILLAIRITLAYGFFYPALRKWSDIDAIAEWFAHLGIPFATFNAYMAATTEALGVVLLSLGLLTRVIALPLIVVMLVAIFTVHLPNGFEASGNGFEIPLYYMLFLAVLFAFGPGKYSLDHLLFKEDIDS